MSHAFNTSAAPQKPRPVFTSNWIGGAGAPGRTTVLVVDEEHIRAGSARAAAQAAGQFLDRLQPEDRVGLVVMPQTSAAIDPATDRARVKDALTHIAEELPVSHYMAERMEFNDLVGPLGPGADRAQATFYVLQLDRSMAEVEDRYENPTAREDDDMRALGLETVTSITGGRRMMLSGRAKAAGARNTSGPRTVNTTASITVTYAFDRKLGMLVPAEMLETHEAPMRSAFAGEDSMTKVNCRATYTDFKRFETSGRMVVPK